MATINNNTNSFTSTNNSKEENVMKTNMSTFAQDCTRTYTYTFAKIFYDTITLGDTLLAPTDGSGICLSEDYYNYRMALYVATEDLDPDPDAEIEFEHAKKITTWAQGIAKQIEVEATGVDSVCSDTCDYHCIHWNDCPFGKGDVLNLLNVKDTKNS